MNRDPITPQKYELIKNIFLEARDLDGIEREAVLDRACAGQLEVRERVVQLLRAYQEDRQAPMLDGLMRVELLKDAAAGPERTSEIPSEQRELPDRVGRYRIQGILGEGGMGIVYLAEQDNPRRTVALKVLRPEVASRQMLRRFEHEARTLGRLQHPNIAQIFDAGTARTESGEQPFFAMELVHGRPLTEYARTQKLPASRRLDLMVKVCDAVQHAHMKGVIHRDLKPGNVLVTDLGDPKVLDFGVARTIDSDIQATTLRTDMGQLIGTIPYMSPEQVLGRSSEVDTRSDVYALGVILYELLADRLPHDLRGRTIPDALRVISEEEPHSLSTVHRGFRGELETIAKKAMEKDRSRRYQSAAHLAADIRSYLLDKPIVARPPSTFYHLRKFAKRNKGLVGGIAAAFVILITSLAGMTYLMLRAREAERTAITEAETAERIQGFLEEMLNSVDPEEARGRDTTILRELLDNAAASIAEELAGQPAVEASIRNIIGNTYRSLGLLEQAEQHMQKSLEVRKSLFGQKHEATLTAMHDLARVYGAQGRYDEEEALLVRILPLRRELLGDEHEHTLAAMNNLALVYRKQGRLDESQELFERTLIATERVLGDEHERTLATKSNLGYVYQLLGRYEEAEPLLVGTLASSRRIHGGDHPFTSKMMNNLAAFYRIQKRLDEALPLFEESMELRRRILGEEHPDTLATMSNLALVQVQRERFEEAEPLYLKTLELRRRIQGDEHIDTLNTMCGLGAMYNKQDRYAEGATVLATVVHSARKTLPQEHWLLGVFLKHYGTSLTGLRRFEEARQALEESFQICSEALGESHVRSSVAAKALAHLYDAWELAEPNNGYAEQASRWRSILQRSARADGT